MVVNVGILGMGFMGNMHFGAHSADRRAKIVAVADIDRKKLKGDASQAGNIAGGGGKRDLADIAVCGGLNAMLKTPGLDVVDICLPTCMHAEHTIKALQAGKHVICEKPMAMNAVEAGRMIAAAKKAKRMLFVGHCIRFWPHYEKADDIVKPGMELAQLAGGRAEERERRAGSSHPRQRFHSAVAG